MKFLLPIHLLLFFTLFKPVVAAAVIEVDVNDAIVSNWFTPAPYNMPEQATHYAFRSPSNNADVGYIVYLPPDYATNTTQTYPVVYMLHGKGGNEMSSLWLVSIVDDAILAGQIKPVIVVFPNAGGETMWSDSYDGKLLTETMVIDELIPLVDSKFRTQKDRFGRFLQGFSMGGFGAGKYLFKYPDLFSSAVTYGGAYHTEETIPTIAEFQSAFGGNIDYFLENSPYTWLDTFWRSHDRRAYPVKIRMAVGLGDSTLQLNRDFRAELTSRGVTSEYLEIMGLKHLPQPYYNTDAVKGFNFHF